MYALETLLESHVDKAFEKFTAWVMRNPFDIPAELEPVLVSGSTRHPRAAPLRRELVNTVPSLGKRASISSEVNTSRRMEEKMLSSRVWRNCASTLSRCDLRLRLPPAGSTLPF
jgi:hypothetical protein